MSAFSKDHNKLGNFISQELARKRAHELGVTPDDLAQKVINGQWAWVLKTELYADLEKQRKLAASPKMLRAIRGGENSLYGLIQANVGQAKHLLNELGANELWSSIERHDCNSSITNVERRGKEAAVRLSDVEYEIEQAKQNDPIHADAEQVLGEIRQAQLDGRNDVVTDIRRSYSDLLRRYQQRRKAIEPQIQSTRNYRQVLQKECWKIMQIVWRLRDALMDSLAISLNIACKERLNETARGQCKKDQQLISSTRKSFATRHREIAAQCPFAQEGAFDKWNQIIDDMRQLLEQQAAFFGECQTFASKYKLSDASDSENRRRMAFTQRSNKDGRIR